MLLFSYFSTVPELDETLTNSSFNGLKDNLNYSSYNQDNFNNSDKIQFSDNNSSKMSRQINSANKRNDLTLPPIVESKVSSTGTNFKKSNSINTRVDSGIAVEYGNDNPTSENEITTIEVVDSNGSLKKNATSSTLNSYGKSSSNQSKTSGNNNNKLGHNKSFKMANNSNDPNYLANMEKLNSLNVNNDEEYFTVNKKNSNNNNDTSNKNQTNKQQSNNPKFDVLSRQNTVTTINNHETLPLVSKQQQNNGTNSSQSNSTQQQQKPVPKPRKNDKIPNGLHRQSTTLLPEQSQLMKEINDKKLLKRENTTITIKNPAATGSNQIARPKTGNANKIATVTFNINTESEFKPNRFNGGDETETSKPLYLVKPDMDYSKLNDDNVDVVAALNLLEHDEAAMNEFTMMRIMKWLEDIENCNNMMQPPSQLAWNNNNNNNNSNNKKADLPSDITRNFNSNEYALSDYDSLDEQIIEYNRVVDKTFNIVHDED